MGPRLSIVLVAHREQGFLEPCLQSVLDGTGDEIEVIAIDDASPDHVPELLEAAAARDARVRVEHRAQRMGLGAGRQAGEPEVGLCGQRRPDAGRRRPPSSWRGSPSWRQLPARKRQGLFCRLLSVLPNLLSMLLHPYTICHCIPGFPRRMIHPAHRQF